MCSERSQADDRGQRRRLDRRRKASRGSSALSSVDSRRTVVESNLAPCGTGGRGRELLPAGASHRSGRPRFGRGEPIRSISRDPKPALRRSADFDLVRSVLHAGAVSGDDAGTWCVPSPPGRVPRRDLYARVRTLRGRQVPARRAPRDTLPLAVRRRTFPTTPVMAKPISPSVNVSCRR